MERENGKRSNGYIHCSSSVAALCKTQTASYSLGTYELKHSSFKLYTQLNCDQDLRNPRVPRSYKENTHCISER